MISEIDIKDWDQIELTLIKENEDGSADYTLHLGPKATNFLVSYAFISVLKQAIEAGKEFTPHDKPGT